MTLHFLSSYSQNDTLISQGSFGKFQNAVSVSSSREQFIFVADMDANIVYKFSFDGKQLASIGGSGFGIDQLSQPMSVDATNGISVYVADYQNNRIQKYDIYLRYVSSYDFNYYNNTADNSSKIYYPRSLAYMSTGDIFVVANASNFRIVKMQGFDQVSLLFGNNNYGIDKLISPLKVAQGKDLEVLILDGGNNQIVEFDSYGTLVKRFDNIIDTSRVISIATYNNYLCILKKGCIITYDLKAGKYSKISYFQLDGSEYPADLTFFNKQTVIILSSSKTYKFNFNFQ